MLSLSIIGPVCCGAAVLPQFKQTLESVVRNGGASPKLAALVQVLRQHFSVRC